MLEQMVKRMPRHVAAVVRVELVATEADLLAQVAGAIDDQSTGTVAPKWSRAEMRAAKMYAGNIHIAILEAVSR